MSDDDGGDVQDPNLLDVDVEKLLAEPDSEDDEFLSSTDADGISIEAILNGDDDDDDEAAAFAYNTSRELLASKGSEEGSTPDTLQPFSEADTTISHGEEEDRDAKLLQKILQETDDEPINDLDQELSDRLVGADWQQALSSAVAEI